MGGAHVFPGGRVEAADYWDDAAARFDDMADVSRSGGLPAEEAAAFRVAAIRELFEEAGVLLARDEAGAMLAVGEDAVERFAVYRHELNAGCLTLAELTRREHLRPALDALALFAHWVTPEVETRRFDTRFFLALAPASQDAAHDRLETTEGTWIAPAAALARCLRGEIALPPPTWTTLRALSRWQTVEEAWQWACSQPAARVQPCFAERADGTRVVMLPGDPECPPVPGFDAPERRFLLEHDRWRPIDPD